MKALYQIAGVSKQAHQQYMNRLTRDEDHSTLFIQMIEEARIMHPVIGLAKIYYLYTPEGIGRDSFINIGTLAGYSLEKRPLTSWKGDRVIPYQNLLSEKYFIDLNQVWVTDITYFKLKDKYYYISMIMDLYSRRILAASVADSLQAFHSINLLKKAIRIRPLPKEHQLIHHSDRGTQYTSMEYTKLLKKRNMGISMCNSVFENSAMERLNGRIKHDYINHWKPKSFEQLKTLLKRAAHNYNNCPHGKLKMLSPIQYEEQLKNIPLHQRTKLEVYTSIRSEKSDPNQLNLFS